MGGTPQITAKKDERKLNFWERLYLPEVLKGLGYSARRMRDPLYTFQYPDEQWYPPDAYRGRPVLVEEEGKPRCVSCNLCARACPPMAISMQSHEIEGPKEREPEWFEINMLRCIYCGFCEEVCPEEAIIMSKEYDLTFHDREEAIFGMDRLLVPKERLKDRLDWLAKQRNPQFGDEVWDHPEENNRHSLHNRPFLKALTSGGAH
ncbi:MAG: NADH-quinone oxidoreductase subunit I [Rhodothermales bacterium]|nr:NADH-quinone oxidoreductase subunit I [Rhodothermales bacterium]MBO6778376.1 NADH-quinone oxidoreductase subunit I [Rhodothermales bacterium]